MPKRIFHIISELDIGGTEKQLLVLLPELQKTMDSEVVCLTGQGPIGTSLQEKGIPVHYLSGRGNTDLRIPVRLWRLLRHKKPDAVVTYLIYADIIGRLVSRLAGIRVIIESHRSSLFGPAWWHQIDRFTRFMVTHYVCQTNATKKLLHQVLRVPLLSITVIPNAVAVNPPATAGRETVRQQCGISLEDTVIVCVANLKPEKDIPKLLGVFETLYSAYPAIHLWLVGDGPERQALERQIRDYISRDRIHFLGLRDDVSRVVSEADIFVLPTRIEGMSNALLEAMAAGLACISTDIPANRDLISHEKTGLLVPVQQEHSLEKAVSRLLDDQLLRRRLASAAREYVQKHHTVSLVAAQWATVIKSQTTL